MKKAKKKEKMKEMMKVERMGHLWVEMLVDQSGKTLVEL